MRLLTLIICLFAATGARAGDIAWRYALGVQNMTVPDVDSNTWGVSAAFSAEKTLPSEIHWLVSGITYVDHDKDHLDPDHIPVWWQFHAGIDGPLTHGSGPWGLAWVADADTKANTVSAVEREIKAMPGLALRWKGAHTTAELKAAAGYFFLEIDDDVPKERGYGRDDFRHNAFAGSLACDGSCDLGASWQLLGHAQTWFDGDGWLENRFSAELRCNVGHWHRDSYLSLSVEVNQYNLDPYSPSAATGPYLPILPWNDDRLTKLSFNTRW